MAKKKIGVTLEPDLHAKVKSAAPLRGTNIEGAYEQALRAWLGMLPPDSTTVIRRSARDQRWHDLLDFVLVNGTQKQIEWLTGNLQTFEEAIRLRRRSESAPESKRTANRKSG